MTASTAPIANSAQNPPSAYPAHWEGHMADDVASTYGAEPCAFLWANADELWLKGNRGDFRIPRRDVTRIGNGGMYPWFFRGIRIRHRVTGFPVNLQFKSLSGKTSDIVAQLRSLGFPTG